MNLLHFPVPFIRICRQFMVYGNKLQPFCDCLINPLFMEPILFCRELKPMSVILSNHLIKGYDSTLKTRNRLL